MSEQTGSTTATEETNEQGNEEPKEFQAITSQEDFDKAIQARIARERAKFADYDQMKADSAELANIRESQKTEAQKQQEALEAANQQIAELTLAKLRAEVAEAKSDSSKGIVIPASLLTGSTKEELEASADALVQFKGDAATRMVVAGEGNSPSKQATTEGEFLKDLFGGGD